MINFSGFNGVWALTIRNIKCYFRDKASVFFSFLSPLIVLLLYILFLGDIQSNAVISILQGIELPVDTNLVSSFVSAWLICGVLSISILTVTLGASGIIVSDKSNNIYKDFIVSPVSRFKIMLSYFLSIFIISFLINFVLIIISQIYLLLTGATLFTLTQLLSLMGILIISLLSSTFLIVFLVSFLKSINAYSVLSTIVGTLIGFLIGAYMPIAMFPMPIQIISNLIPASYTNALLKTIIMKDYLSKLIPAGFTEAIKGFEDNFSMNLYLGYIRIPEYAMIIVLIASIFVFMLLNLAHYKNKHKIKRIQVNKDTK